jgi:hypothetical protein
MVEAGPDLREGNPENAIGQAEVRTRRRSAQVGELLAEGEILEGELGTGAEGRAKRGEQVEKAGERGQAAQHAKSQPCRLCGFLQSPTEKRASG